MHGLLTCHECGKECNTVSALKKHAYDHMDKSKAQYQDCIKSFPFTSKLKSHRKVHLTALEHHCIRCNKSYKSHGELVKHQNIHTGKRWMCQHGGCTYSCNDPRNLRAHMHSHGGNTHYHCDTCEKGFNFYMQLKHHHAKNCKNAASN